MLNSRSPDAWPPLLTAASEADIGVLLAPLKQRTKPQAYGASQVVN